MVLLVVRSVALAGLIELLPVMENPTLGALVYGGMLLGVV